MKAMVFAAGVGSRLKELTSTSPKCLMQIGGVPMLELVINRLKEVGVQEVMINLHHLPDVITEFVQKRNNFGINVQFSYEEKLLDTGGGLKKVCDFFKDEDFFFIHNSDVYSTFDLKAAVKAHTTTKSAVTLFVLDRPSKRGLYFDAEDTLLGWTGEPDLTLPSDAKLFSFCGMHIASPEIFSFMPEHDTFSILKPYVICARAGGTIKAHIPVDGEWIDIGTPEQLHALQARFV